MPPLPEHLTACLSFLFGFYFPTAAQFQVNVDHDGSNCCLRNPRRYNLSAVVSVPLFRVCISAPSLICVWTLANTGRWAKKTKHFPCPLQKTCRVRVCYVTYMHVCVVLPTCTGVLYYIPTYIPCDVYIIYLFQPFFSLVNPLFFFLSSSSRPVRHPPVSLPSQALTTAALSIDVRPYSLGGLIPILLVTSPS